MSLWKKTVFNAKFGKILVENWLLTIITIKQRKTVNDEVDNSDVTS